MIYSIKYKLLTTQDFTSCSPLWQNIGQDSLLFCTSYVCH